MSVNRLSTRFRVREDVFDSITPNNVVQRDVSAPAGEWKPAAWLPIVFKKSNVSAGEDAFVISSGKVVALDADNRIVPAGLRAALDSGAASLVYGADDYAYGVTDLVTGVAVASASGASYSAAEVATALIERGLVSTDILTSGSAFDSGSATDITEVIEEFISEAIGVAAYDIFVYSGRPEDGDQVFTNYSKQHLVQFLTELQMKVPHRTLGSDTTAFDATPSTGATVVTAQAAAGDMPAAGEVWTETALDDVARYASVVDGMSVVALKLDNDFIAKNTSRTEISCDVAGVLVKEKSELALLKAEGDFYVDTRLGVVFIHSDTWDTLVTATATATITYYHYGAGVANSERYVFLGGEPRPGAFLSYDSRSNFCEMGSADDVLGTSNTRSIARLLNIDVEPKDLLQHVKTAFNLTGMSAASKMPGTATSGFSDAITLATEEQVADQLAVLNLKVN